MSPFRIVRDRGRVTGSNRSSHYDSTPIVHGNYATLFIPRRVEIRRRVLRYWSQIGTLFEVCLDLTPCKLFDEVVSKNLDRSGSFYSLYIL